MCKSLQHAHVPTENAGLERLYAFTTFECRAQLTTRKGKNTIGRFCQYAELYTLLGCMSFALVGDVTVIPATQTRGAIASIAVDVTEVLGYYGPSGFERQQQRDPRESGEVKVERYRFQLQQERRPPLAGCWLVTNILPMREHMMFNVRASLTVSPTLPAFARGPRDQLVRVSHVWQGDSGAVQG